MTGTAKNENGTMSLVSLLEESARRHKDRTALVLGDEQVTYHELWQQVRQYAGALQNQGVKRGDRVALLIPNVTAFPRLYYAVLALGAIVVPIHALLKSKEIEHILNDCGASLLVVAASLRAEAQKASDTTGVSILTVMDRNQSSEIPRLEELALQATPLESYLRVHPDETATILYTSGTTGQPKGAEGTHFALISQVNALLLDTFDLRTADRIIGTLPLFHTFGQTCVMNTGARVGGTVILIPRFDANEVVGLVERDEADIFFGVPTMFIALLEAAKGRKVRGRLRYAVSGGASLPESVLEEFQQVFGAPIYEGYGLTETSPVASFNHVGIPPRPGTIGQAIWGVEIEIADADRDDQILLLPHGQIGELVIRGHNLMKGYFGKPEATASAVVDGWFRSGDLGTKSEDGYLRILDRKKDIVLRNGNNVYPREIEEVIMRHPAVQSVAVFGIPHEVYGQEIVAAIVPAEGTEVTAEEISEYTQDNLAAYKYPRIIHLVESLPLGSSGKVLKRELVSIYTSKL